MEKICIARRRITENPCYLEQEKNPAVSCREDRDEEVLSIAMPADQPGIVQSNLKDTIAGLQAESVRCESHQEENGQIVFNFHFNKMDSIRMLKPSQVCLMLQIGKGTLAGLVRSGHLGSYLIGSRRRFLFQDVMNYLRQCRELSDQKECEPVQNTVILRRV